MLNTKDVSGYLAPLRPVILGLHAVSIPGEKNTLSANDTAAAAQEAGLAAQEAIDVEAALRSILKAEPQARVLICGSLYLAGRILRDHS